MKNALLVSLILSSILASMACSEAIEIDDMEENPVLPDPFCPSDDCLSEFIPIVFVHGFLGSGDTYNNHVRRFIANEYPKSYCHLYDYNSVGVSDNINQLDSFIDEILFSTGKTKVNLVGHSAGGGVSYEYLEDSIRASKVLKYAHIGSNANSAPPGPNVDIETINIYSDGDLVVPGDDIPGAQNVMLDNQDHYEVATSQESFIALYQFFNDDEPMTVDPMPSSESFDMAGVVKSFAENTSEPGVSVSVFAIANDGERQSDNPIAVFTTDDQGRWGPFSANANDYHEFVLTKENDPAFRPIHYYHSRTNSEKCDVYLRSFPPPNTFAGSFLSAIPEDDNETVIIVFSSAQAVISGRDNLMIDNVELSNADLASADQTTIAFFAYDDGDGMTSGNKLATFSMFPFLNGVDIALDANVDQKVDVTLNGESMLVNRWRSGSDGPVVIIFE